MSRHYLEYGGGLGDVFNQMHINNSYNLLLLMPEGDTAEVVTISHNPAVKELFVNHPRSADIHLRSFDYWLCRDDAAKRREHGLPTSGAVWRVAAQPGPLKFFPWPSDEEIIASLPKPFVVIAATAGQFDRDIIQQQRDRIMVQILDAGYPVVIVGRNYERHGRKEFRKVESMFRYHDNVIDLVDRLTVGGTAQLLQKSAGMVACHSSLNILGWHLRVPQLLVYPVTVQDHLVAGNEWGFGCRYPETVTLRMEDFGMRAEKVKAFISKLR